MFAETTNLILTDANGIKYIISLGYVLPDDKKIEELTEIPEFCYVIRKEVSEDNLEIIEPSDDEFYKYLDNTARIFSKGFVDGSVYTKTLFELHNKKEPANDNKLVL